MKQKKTEEILITIEGGNFETQMYLLNNLQGLANPAGFYPCIPVDVHKNFFEGKKGNAMKKAYFVWQKESSDKNLKALKGFQYFNFVPTLMTSLKKTKPNQSYDSGCVTTAKELNELLQKKK